MEQLIVLANLVKTTYIELMKQDVANWVEEKGLAISHISFDIRSPFCDAGESSSDIGSVGITLDGKTIRSDDSYDSMKDYYTLFKEMEEFVVKQTNIYEEKTGLCNLLEHLEDVPFDLQAKGQ